MIERIRLLIRNHFWQLFRFGLVGTICFCMEYGSYYLMTKVLIMNVYYSNFISLILATTLNYILSRLMVFKPGKHSLLKEIITFYLVSSISIGLNMLIHYICINFFDIEDGVSKLIAIGLVLTVNFFLKKFIVFDG